MSKSRYNVPRTAIHVGAPAKSFSAAEGYEPERRGWDENTYRLKNQDANNHYDFSRKHLNFEINNKGEIVPLCSDPVPLHERLQKRLDELGFKPYMDKNNPLGISDNSPNCTVGIIVGGDHRVLTRLAFGDQDVDFTLQKSNAHVVLKQAIKDWALDTYHWACDRWGAENIIGFDVHLDETTPHIHIQTIPVAKTKARGCVSVKYVHKDDKSKVLSHKEWKKLPEEIRSDFVRTEVERREKECVSYARVWGEDKYITRCILTTITRWGISTVWSVVMTLPCCQVRKDVSESTRTRLCWRQNVRPRMPSSESKWKMSAWKVRRKRWRVRCRT